MLEHDPNRCTSRARPATAWTLLPSLAALVLYASTPAAAHRDDRDHRARCQNDIESFTLTAQDGTQTVVSLDEIVPEALQPMIRTDPDALTGIWISDLDLWTPVNPLACQIPKASDCPAGALEGACPERPPTANAYTCSSTPTWVNNTFALYELKTGSLYALNLWRVWSQQTWPTVEALRRARPPVDFGGFSFQNGVRNIDDRMYMMSSMGEPETFGTGRAGVFVQLGDLVPMAGRVYDSNVGQVIISETRTSTATSLIYSPTSPNQAVWKLNLRRVRGCVDGTTFEEQVFPPRRPIRIERTDERD